MVSHLISLVLVVSILLNTSFASASKDHRISPRSRHHQLANRAAEQSAPTARLRRRRNSCKPPKNNTTNFPVPKPKPSPTQPTQLNSAVPQPNENGGLSGSGGGTPSSGWPTVTQAGAVPAATRTSPADPYLRSLSDPLNNSANPLFTEVHVGQMTY